MHVQKQTKQLARQLYKLSFAEGRLSDERVGGVLSWVEKTQPHQSLALLKLYLRLIAIEVAKGQAVVEHAGPLSGNALQSIAASLSKRYDRPVTITAEANPSLLAGLRVRIGDDVYESSLSSQLAALGASV